MIPVFFLFPREGGLVESNKLVLWMFWSIPDDGTSSNMIQLLLYRISSEAPGVLTTREAPLTSSRPLVVRRPRCAVACTCITQLGRILLPNYQGKIINSLIAGDKSAAWRAG